MRVLILGYKYRPDVEAAVDQLRPLIASCAEIVAEDLTGEMDLSSATAQADIALVFGGDGSILRAIQQMGVRQLPIVAVNLGRLGFLANLSVEQLPELLPVLREHLILQGENWIENTLESKLLGIQRSRKSHFTISEHLMLNCTVTRPKAVVAGETFFTHIINEVAIQSNSHRIIEVDLFADGEFVTTYSCDGLILSTPVGSTAHSLSAGGPILRQDLDALVIVPIAPHTLTYRPVVDSARRAYQLTVHGDDCVVVTDGTVLCELTPTDTVSVKASDIRFRMLNPPGYSYYTNLQGKLGWSGHAKFQ